MAIVDNVGRLKDDSDVLAARNKQLQHIGKGSKKSATMMNQGRHATYSQTNEENKLSSPPAG